MKVIGGWFGRSPFGALHEHMAKVQECVDILPQAVDAFLAGDWERCRKKAEVISRVEHEADTIKNAIRGQLSISIFSSVERADILSMLKTQDAVADRCEDVADLLVLRRRPFPPFLKEPFTALIGKVKETTQLLLGVMRELNRIFDESPKRESARRMFVEIDRLHETEHEADILEHKLREELFEHETDVDPVTVMILYHLIAKVGCIADAAENVGDCLRAWIETR